MVYPINGQYPFTPFWALVTHPWVMIGQGVPVWHRRGAGRTGRARPGYPPWARSLLSAPPFKLIYTPSTLAVLTDLAAKAQFKVKAKKVAKALRLLEQPGPSYPGLATHLHQSVKGPNGEPLWESYVANKTPNAWRIRWVYGPASDTLTIITVSPHP